MWLSLQRSIYYKFTPANSEKSDSGSALLVLLRNVYIVIPNYISWNFELTVESNLG